MFQIEVGEILKSTTYYRAVLVKKENYNDIVWNSFEIVLIVV